MLRPAMPTSLRRFLTLAFWEGISFLVLVLVCMPLKYLADIPWPVRAVGSIHGALFVAYAVALAACLRTVGLREATLAMAISFVPGGTFWLDARWRRLFGARDSAGLPAPSP
jgi:integral membrane protein